MVMYFPLAAFPEKKFYRISRKWTSNSHGKVRWIIMSEPLKTDFKDISSTT